jgi:hypothetical protein
VSDLYEFCREECEQHDLSDRDLEQLAVEWLFENGGDRNDFKAWLANAPDGEFAKPKPDPVPVWFGLPCGPDCGNPRGCRAAGCLE